MKKTLILLGIILISSTQFSCSNKDDEDLVVYQENVDVFSTGGEEEQNPPPPPPPPAPDPDGGN